MTKRDTCVILILRTKEKLNRILAQNTGRNIEEIAADTERDNWKTAEEAKEYGLIDAIFTSHSDISMFNIRKS